MKKSFDMIPLNQIVHNPWRDLKLNPLDDEHIADLREAMGDFEFQGALTGRKRDDGKIEIAYGHARLAAAKKAKIDAVPVEIANLDDDDMLRLMTDENALQTGGHPGATMNEVAAVTQRLIEAILKSSDNCPKIIAQLFAGPRGLENVRGTLLKGNNVHRALGVDVIRAYLSNRRGERAVREAISALKQSAIYDDMVETTLRKYAKPIAAKPDAKREIEPSKAKSRPEKVLDERTATVFKNDAQFHAFRDAVTSSSAKRVLPVESQLPLAKKIMDSAAPSGGSITKKKSQIGAPYITKMVQTEVQAAIKEQREIDKEERDRYRMEQIGEMIDKELHSANASYRSMLSALIKLERLARQYPGHPKITGFVMRLEQLSNAIKQFIKEANKKIA